MGKLYVERVRILFIESDRKLCLNTNSGKKQQEV